MSKKRFPKAKLKLISVETREAMNGMSERGLDALIVESTTEISTTQELLLSDEKVIEAKAAVAEASADYNDTIKAPKAKIEYALYVKRHLESEE